MTTTRTEYRDALQIAAKEVVSEGVVVVSLRRPDGGALPEWSAGAHIDLALPNGVTRQYSLCGRPEERDTFRIGVLREVASRGGSSFVHDRLRIGDLVTIHGPRNNFGWLPSRRQLFIAGGIGITPILPMIAEAERHGSDWRLLYGGRRRGSMAFLEELAPYGDKVIVAPEDVCGRLDLARHLAWTDPETRIYCCGPEPLLAAVETLCATRPEGMLHIERFKAREASGEARTFEVELRRSRTTLVIPPDKTILQTIQAAGLIVPCSCEEGTCGTCETNVIEGEPDHRDSVLSKAEQDSNRVMMICVSRAKGDRLVIDL